jgi:5-methyltetrahydropteroyltriglutamate--homocysteine methyltransferase
MIKSCDVGSLPFVGGLPKFLEGASNYGKTETESTRFFEEKLVASFIDKAKAGIDVPNYPQFRDMGQMFLDKIEGISKVDGGYAETGTLRVKDNNASFSEIEAIGKHSNKIKEELGAPFQLRICVTGPYTLSSIFAYKDQRTFARLGTVLTHIIETSIFNDKNGRVKLVSVDEPAFGFVDDPLLDRGSEGRENLLEAWESMMHAIKTKGAQSCLHLHNTSDELFWEVKELQLIESHVNDPFYQTKRTKERLEATDKFLKASIAVTVFDQLIGNYITQTSKQKLNETSLNEKIAETWQSLRKKQVDPAVFVENSELLKDRLSKAVEFFGENRVPYAGPECGLWSFPSYETALECLRRVSKVVKAV